MSALEWICFGAGCVCVGGGGGGRFYVNSNISEPYIFPV